MIFYRIRGCISCPALALANLNLASLVGSVRRTDFSWKDYRHEAKTAGMPATPLTLQFGFESCKPTGGASFPEGVWSSILLNPHHVIILIGSCASPRRTSSSVETLELCYLHPVSTEVVMLRPGDSIS
jgi:hypothetical protein